jgi:hypothetical protein
MRQRNRRGFRLFPLSPIPEDSSHGHRHHAAQRLLRRRSRPLQLRLRRPLPGRVDLPRLLRAGRGAARRRPPGGRGECRVDLDPQPRGVPRPCHERRVLRRRAPPRGALRLVVRRPCRRRHRDRRGRAHDQGHHPPVEARGTWVAPASDALGNTRAHLQLEAVVDRTAYEMRWNMQLPSGAPALASEVTVTVELSLVEQQG